MKNVLILGLLFLFVVGYSNPPPLQSGDDEFYETTTLIFTGDLELIAIDNISISNTDYWVESEVTVFTADYSEMSIFSISYDKTVDFFIEKPGELEIPSFNNIYSFVTYSDSDNLLSGYDQPYFENAVWYPHRGKR